MFQEYAVDPKLFSTLEQFKYWSKDFGAERGRLISEYPSKEWIKMAHEAIAEKDTVKRQSLSARISKMREHKMLAKFKRTDYHAAEEWLNNACRQHRRSSFHAIVATDAPAGIPGVLLADEIDYETPAFSCKIDIECERSGQALARMLRVLLLSAYELKIIDPYFHPDDGRCVRPLRELLNTAIQGVPLKNVELHVAAKHSTDREPAYFSDKCHECLGPLVPTGCRLQVFKWNDQPGGKKLHDRFILSGLGGVKLGIGIAEQPGDKVHMQIVSEDTRKALWEDYSDRSTVFALDVPPITVS